jgi:hypothetical protein
MSPGDEARMVPKARQGVCHRCGWSGTVAEVRRDDRKRMNTGRMYGRLCSECVDDLLHNQSFLRSPEATGRANLKALRDRDVA